MWFFCFSILHSTFVQFIGLSFACSPICRLPFHSIWLCCSVSVAIKLGQKKPWKTDWLPYSGSSCVTQYQSNELNGIALNEMLDFVIFLLLFFLGLSSVRLFAPWFHELMNVKFEWFLSHSPLLDRCDAK